MKNTTPMQILKSLMSQYKTLPGFTFFELNRKQGGNKFVGSNMYTSKPVTFDYVALLGFGGVYHDLGSHKRFVNTISLAFSYTDRETPVVRAGVCHRGHVDYSLEFDIPTAKKLIAEFLTNPTTDNIVRLFNIVQSSKLNDSAVRAFKAPYLERVNALKVKIDDKREILRIKRDKYYDLLKKRIDDSKLNSEVHSLVKEVENLQREMRHIFKEETKDMPHVVRHSFNKETEQVQFRY